MAEKIYVLIDHGQGEVRNGSLEALAWGQKMAAERGGEVHAVMLSGPDQEAARQVADSAQASSLLWLRHERLADYDPDAYAAALKDLVRADKPGLLLMAHIYQNIDLAPKLAVAVEGCLITDCIGHKRDDGGLVFVRQMFRNKLNADIRPSSGHPCIATLQAGAVSRDELQAGQSPLQERQADLDQVPQRRVSLEKIGAGKGQVDLTKADVIVGVGRGVKKEENLAMVRELAEVLGAEIGASRPVVDNDWMERERQIGSSGQNVSPKLYIALGISGAIQHIVGMKGSNTIVAVNTDPNAPIFNIATYGIVGDLFEIVPALIEKLRAD
ncbi:MAG TPA: electron transfer flavoprotein subunit alpha/FixB family protein [Acidobacteriota bacterium]|nr:electron transfer flavoprotein subunit alpha/FixB family protein [Acidobacteriota bacterium]